MRVGTLSLLLLMLAAPARAATSGACSDSPSDATAKLVAALDDLGVKNAARRYGAVTIGDDASVAALPLPERKRMAREAFDLLADPDLAKGRSCEKRSIRYDAASLLSSILDAAPASDRAGLYRDLTAAASAERDPQLARFLALELDRTRSSVPAALAAQAKPLIDAQLPPDPPYGGIFGDSKSGKGDKDTIHVQIHAGIDTFREAGYAGTFRALGATVYHRSKTDWTIRWTVTPTGGGAPVKYVLHLVDQWKGSFDHFDMFRQMDQKTPEIEVYDFHSQYGTALDESLRDAPAHKGADKLWIVAACKSKVFASRVQAKYPNTQFVYTEDGEYFSDTPHMLARTLQSLADRKSWTAIKRDLDANDLGNYHFPNERVDWRYLDSDGDGVPDAVDRLLACGLSRTTSRDTFQPRMPSKPIDQLQGEKVLHAVTVAATVAGYAKPLHGDEDKFIAAGWAPADLNGPIAVFGRDDQGRWTVKVNAAYSHLSDLALAAALTNRLALYGVTRGGRGQPTLEDKILAYECGVDLISAWDPDGTIYDKYQAAFGFEKPIPFEKAEKALSEEDGATRQTIRTIKELLSR